MSRNHRVPVSAAIGLALLGSVVAAVVAVGGTPSAATAAPAPVTAAGPAAPPAAGPAAAPAADAPLGDVVRTGLRGPSGERVLYAVRVRERQLPGTTFGLVLGHLRAGRPTADVLANEFQGSDRAPGFHAVQDAMTGAARNDVAVFGYYAGPAADVTALAGGRRVHASTAAWSMDRRVVFFWFGTRDTKGAGLTGLTALDAQGRELPAGDTGIGVG